MSRSWIVGGALRDELLGREVTDIDIAVEGDPEQAARELAAELRGPVFQLSEAFGAWRVVDRRAGRVYDFAPLQGETIEDDLAKRDFSVNAMARPLAAGGAAAASARGGGAAAPAGGGAAPPVGGGAAAPAGGGAAAPAGGGAVAASAGGDLIDPLGGRADLEARTLRVLGPAAYENDPLRPLRLARFAAELGFKPDAETELLTAEVAPRVAEASGERVFAELRRLVLAPGAVEGLNLADRLGLLSAVLPELADLHEVEQSHYHHLDVYGHTIEVFERLIELESDATGELREVLEEPLADELTRGEALRFGALLHDIGKPATHDVRADGRVTFMGHDRLGEEMVRAICRRLRASERLCRFLEGVTRHHLVLGFLVHERPLDRHAVYRYLERTSPVEVEVTLLSVADRLATRGKNAERAIDAHLELAEELMPAALEWRRSGPPRVPVRGDELAAELGIEQGPELGRLLDQLAEAAYAGEATDRQQAIDLARTLRHNAER